MSSRLGFKTQNILSDSLTNVVFNNIFMDGSHTYLRPDNLQLICFETIVIHQVTHTVLQVLIKS